MLTCFLLVALCPAVLASAAEEVEYPLWIGGIHVTSSNCDKLADNNWSYDPSTNTLTLDNYVYSGLGYEYMASRSACIFYNGTDDLTISLSGKSKITHSKSWAYDEDIVIFYKNKSAALIFTGTGSLELKMSDGWGGPAIYSEGNVVISSGSLKAEGGLKGIISPKVTIKKEITSVEISGFTDSATAIDGTLVNEVSGVSYNKWKQLSSIPVNNSGSTTNQKAVAFPAQIFKLVYEPNGGAGSMDPVEEPEGTMMALPDCGFEAPEGKIFSYWEVSGTDILGAPGTEIMFARNCVTYKGYITVTPKWIDAPAATVKTAPKGQDGTYTGSPLELVTAGEAEDGVIQFAFGEDATNAPVTGWSTDIPTGSDPKTYYVWYRAGGDSTHSNSKKTCITVTIGKANATVTAIAQTIKEGENPGVAVDNANPSGLAGSDTLNAVTITVNGDKLIPSGAEIVNGKGENVTGNYNITYTQGDLNVLHKISVMVTFSVANGEWDNGGNDVIEVVLSGFEGDTLKLKADQIPGAGTKPASNYKQGTWNVIPDTETAITKDTSYVYTYAKAAVDTPPVQTNTDPSPDTEKTVSPVYTVTVQGDGYTPGSGKDIVFTAKRNVDDNKTFGNFKSATMDGNPISEKFYDKAPGSLILTLKSAYLDTLSSGNHTIKITFTDGEATVAITIAQAPSRTNTTPTPSPLPKTGETGNSFIGIIWLLTGTLVMLFVALSTKVSRKKAGPASYTSRTNHRGR